MLPWWGWALLWTVLVGASALWLGLLARRVWRSAKAVAQEAERAGGLVAELEARADELRVLEPPPVAVTADPRRLREERREQRERQRADRRERRAERLPPWARVH